MKAANLCLICKGGRSLCGNKTCPLLARIRLKPKMEKLSDNFFGPSPGIFVGRVGWPNVGIGPLGALNENPGIDNPSSWWGKPYSDVIEIRSALLRSKQMENIKSKSRVVEIVQELALSSSPTDIEALFKKQPVYRVSFSDIVQPMGPTAVLKEVRLAQNVKISGAVEKIVRDDISASHAGWSLYENENDVYKVTNILSSGILGTGERKKLVPTRWSITAVDDMIAKHMMQEVGTNRSVNTNLVFESSYLGNHFVILMMPGSWEFENFEAWAPGSFWSQQLKQIEIVEEYEPYTGRTSYAEQQGGGYYASRLGCVEYLYNAGRQARVVVFREIDESYTIPLGVWVVRETVRNAFRQSPKEFSDLNEAKKYIATKTRLNLSDYTSKSKVLKQKKLADFF